MDQPAPGTGTEPADRPLPAPLRAAVLLLAAEAAVVAVVAAFLLYEDVTATATNLPGALFLTAFAAGAAAALAAIARALHRCRGGARGLAVVLQLMLLPIGYYMIQGGLAWLGAPIMALGVLATGLLVAPSSTRALGLDRPRGAS